jgi:phenylpropionate dioxygenase-like ring-hydroxylating dioxygenase large terminal subunit
MRFLRSAWYVAAWSDDLQDSLVSRTMLNEPVLLYRQSSGLPVAIQDRCPHRFAPLSMGKLIDDIIECPYHGLRFDSSGACVFNPHGDGKIPRAAKVKSYPLMERNGILWIWMGDPNEAEPEKVPSFDILNDPGLKTVKGTTKIGANYQIVADNLLDLTHTQFVHARSQKTENLLVVPHEVVQEGTTVHSRRWVANTKGALSFMRNFADPNIAVDHWMRATWEPPGLCRLDVGVTPAGQSESSGIRRRGSHLLTPETETSTHYFFANTRNYRQTDPQADQDISEWQRIGFEEEDKPILEAVQKLMGTPDLMSQKPVLLSPDAAAMRARRIMENLIAREASAGQEGRAIRAV